MAAAPPASRLKPAVLEALAGIVGRENVLSDPEDLAVYAYDGTWDDAPPDAVVTVLNTQQVAQVLALANAERIPIVGRGAGSGLSGGAIPVQGGIVLNLARMDRILEIDAVDMCAAAEPGVVLARFHAEVEKRGLFYPPDPASLKQCTLGGNVAESAGGPRGVKYGTTKDYVLELEVVLAGGQVIRTGGKPVKNVTGYNLTQLFIGSEGTLGIITWIRVRLIPLPPAQRTLMAVFPRLEDACASVTRILGAGIVPVAIELFDTTTVKCVNAYTGIGLPEDAEAIVLAQVDGDAELVVREIAVVAEQCRLAGAATVKVASSNAEADGLWAARRAISPSLGRVAPNKLGEDISVPRSQIPEAVRRIQAISRRYAIPIAIFGHAGDGNLHPNLLFDKRRPGEIERVQAAAGEIFKTAVDLGGTLSGEHGIGLLKMPYVPLALSPEVISLSKQLKRVFDPNGILNPGKVFP